MPGPDQRPALRTPLCDLLGCEVPVLLAGMGGVARAELAAAVARAGGYAMLGMVREDPDLIEAEITAYRAATARPFAVNVIPSATDPALLQAQISRCLDLGVRAFTFFWDVRPEVIAQVKREGCLVLHQVGTLAAAREAEAAGADVIITQGIEAGGHVHGRTGAFALAEAVLDGTRLPVVMSGGITTGHGLAAALMLGAQGVQCGTAFLATNESWAHDYHKQRVAAAGADDTVLTDIFVLNWPKGAAVRVLGNSVTAGLDGQLMGHDPATLPRVVIAHDSGQPLLRYSTDSPMRHTSGALEEMALYAGQGVGAVRDVVPAAERLHRIVDEARDCLARPAAMTSDPEAPGRYASPPCMAAEVDPAYFDPLAVDLEQARDVARWRRAERARLRSERDALSVADRQAAGAAIVGHLADLLRKRFGTMRGRVFSGYWPIKGEPDLRPLLAALDDEGALVALPLVEVKAAPLVFRRWTRETRMVRGDWNIPVPPPEAEAVTPEIALAPLVGWTAEGFRLGYGGGYFDRTLAALSPRPFTIGIGFQSARLATIYPQPHDIALDAVVTEAGIAVPPYGT